ncbi:MAG: hypothetical protein OXR68_05645 [Alphaproteobacteria bacterium]|nr:hypothetical protein [Alphaproteobacteria bacterium]MDD9920088.1 hypothetical protein [Alphaproteobacteria bacterium]
MDKQSSHELWLTALNPETADNVANQIFWDMLRKRYPRTRDWHCFTFYEEKEGVSFSGGRFSGESPEEVISRQMLKVQKGQRSIQVLNAVAFSYMDRAASNVWDIVFSPDIRQEKHLRFLYFTVG